MGRLNIRKAMDAKSISIEAMANILHLHRNSVANKINGKCPFSVDEAFKLRDTLFKEYNIDYLFSPESTDDSDRNPRE